MTLWLRDRNLDRLQRTDGSFRGLDGAIGEHRPDRVRAAAEALAPDGVLVLDASDDALLRGRLPLARTPAAPSATLDER